MEFENFQAMVLYFESIKRKHFHLEDIAPSFHDDKDFPSLRQGRGELDGKKFKYFQSNHHCLGGNYGIVWEDTLVDSETMTVVEMGDYCCIEEGEKNGLVKKLSDSEKQALYQSIEISNRIKFLKLKIQELKAETRLKIKANNGDKKNVIKINKAFQIEYSKIQEETNKLMNLLPKCKDIIS